MSLSGSSGAVFERVLFNENSAGSSGGAVLVAGRSHPLFRHSVFAGNSCEDDGGAISMIETSK